MSNALKPGDTVTLRSGGRVMTIERDRLTFDEMDREVRTMVIRHAAGVLQAKDRERLEPLLTSLHDALPKTPSVTCIWQSEDGKMHRECLEMHTLKLFEGAQ